MAPPVKSYADALRAGLGGQVTPAAHLSHPPMATTSETPPSAVSRVFGTTELLENILMNVATECAHASLACLARRNWKALPPPPGFNGKYSSTPRPLCKDPKQLFSLQRVNKRFLDVIQGSIGLQQLMFLVPANNSTATNMADKATPVLWLLGSMCVIVENVLGIDSEDGRACLICLSNVGLEGQDGFGPGFDKPLLDHFRGVWNHSEASWRQIQVSRSDVSGAGHLELMADIHRTYLDNKNISNKLDNWRVIRWMFGRGQVEQTLGEVFDK